MTRIYSGKATRSQAGRLLLSRSDFQIFSSTACTVTHHKGQPDSRSKQSYAQRECDLIPASQDTDPPSLDERTGVTRQYRLTAVAVQRAASQRINRFFTGKSVAHQHRQATREPKIRLMRGLSTSAQRELVKTPLPAGGTAARTSQLNH